jgi:hypothetical protein
MALGTAGVEKPVDPHMVGGDPVLRSRWGQFGGGGLSRWVPRHGAMDTLNLIRVYNASDLLPHVRHAPALRTLVVEPDLSRPSSVLGLQSAQEATEEAEALEATNLPCVVVLGRLLTLSPKLRCTLRLNPQPILVAGVYDLRPQTDYAQTLACTYWSYTDAPSLRAVGDWFSVQRAARRIFETPIDALLSHKIDSCPELSTDRVESWLNVVRPSSCFDGCNCCLQLHSLPSSTSIALSAPSQSNRDGPFPFLSSSTGGSSGCRGVADHARFGFSQSSKLRSM